jgi:hypothetical protein
MVPPKKGRPPKSGEGFSRQNNRRFWETKEKPSKSLYTVPDQTHITMSPKQATFIEAALSGQYNYLMYGGAIRGGKTYVALTLAQILCRVFPGSRWAIVRKDLPTLRRNTLPAWKKVAVPGFAGPINQGDWSVTCANGSVLFFFAESIRDDPDLDRWKGLEVNGFVLEEANELDYRSWEKAIERAGSWILPGTVPQPPPLIIATSNPAWGWVKTTFYDPWRVGRLKAPYYYQQATVFDNPHVAPAYLESLKNLRENHYKRFVLGDWSVAAGLAFGQWDDTVHLLDDYDIPQYGVRVLAGMDWGIRAKSVIVLATVDQEGTVTCVKEWYWTDKDAFESGYEWALNLLAANLPFPELVWCDPAMWNRLGTGGKTIGDEFQAGIGAALSGSAVKCVPAPRGQGMRHQKFNLWNKHLAWGPRLADGTLPRSKQPAIRFVGKDCPYLVSSLPALPLDPTDSEDIDTTAEDHGYDAVGALLLGLRPAAKPVLTYLTPENMHPGYIPGTGQRRSNLRTPEIEMQEALVAAHAQHQEIGGRYGIRARDGLTA